MLISYKGKTFETKNYLPMSDGEFAALREEYYAKPPIADVRNEVMKIFLNGNITMTNIKKYFFRDIMSHVQIYCAKWTIDDMFSYKPIIEVFNAKIALNDEVFLPSMTKLEKIMKSVDLGGAGLVKIPTNFDLGQTIEIIKKYNTNGNYYDPSCGWGVRLVASLACGVNYFGTDPNTELTPRLRQVAQLFSDVDLFAPSCDIRTQGSEKFIPEWENKMGFVFTSPPYFFLEDYGIGEQSTTLYPEYDDWLKYYYLPTFANAYKYLINGGKMLINIKNYGKYDLEEQTKILACKCGFRFIGTETFSNIQRINNTGELNENGEDIFVFVKQE